MARQDLILRTGPADPPPKGQEGRVLLREPPPHVPRTRLCWKHMGQGPSERMGLGGGEAAALYPTQDPMGPACV